MEESFSIKDYIMSDDDFRTVVINYRQDYKTQSMPLVRIWYRMMFQSAISVGEYKPKKGSGAPPIRAAFVIDELSDLVKGANGADDPMLQSMLSLVQLGRSMGNCVVVAYQDYAVIKQIAGEEFVDSFENCLATKCAAKLGASSIAKHVSEAFGDITISKPSVSVTNAPGQEAMRDSNGYAQNEIEDVPSVSSSNLLNLPILEFYLNFDNAKTRLPITWYETTDNGQEALAKRDDRIIKPEETGEFKTFDLSNPEDQIYKMEQ